LTDNWLHDFYNDAANAPPLRYRKLIVKALSARLVPHASS